jgi:predicted amidohydrolase
MDLKIACYQMDIFWHEPHRNLNKIEAVLKNHKNDFDILILPEMFTTGFTKENHLFSVEQQKTIDFLKELSKKYQGIFIGSIIFQEKNQFFNRLFVVYPNGNLQFYDKRHLFTMAKEDLYYQPGKQKIIIEYKGWKILPLICFDLRFPVWSRNELKNDKGYDLAIYVANWPKVRIEHWNALLKARAIENQCFVIGCNRIGCDGYNIEYNGASTIYDYEGNKLAYSENQEIILQANLSYKNLINYRKNFPAFLSSDDFQIKI